MTVQPCPECSLQLDVETALCPRCGAEVTESVLIALSPESIDPNLFNSDDPSCRGCGVPIDRTASFCPKCGRRDAGAESEYFLTRRYLPNFFCKPSSVVPIDRRKWMYITGSGALLIAVLLFADLAEWRVLPFTPYVYRVSFWLSVLAGMILLLFAKTQPTGACPSCGTYVSRDFRAPPWTAEYIATHWCPDCGQPFNYHDLYGDYFSRLRNEEARLELLKAERAKLRTARIVEYDRHARVNRKS